MKLKILKIKDGSFKGDTGEPIEYFWVKSETENGETIEFGTKSAEFEIGTTHELDIDKIARQNGTYKYLLAKD